MITLENNNFRKFLFFCSAASCASVGANDKQDSCNNEIKILEKKESKMTTERQT